MRFLRRYKGKWPAAVKYIKIFVRWQLRPSRRRTGGPQPARRPARWSKNFCRQVLRWCMLWDMKKSNRNQLSLFDEQPAATARPQKVLYSVAAQQRFPAPAAPHIPLAKDPVWKSTKHTHPGCRGKIYQRPHAQIPEIIILACATCEAFVGNVYRGKTIITPAASLSTKK